MRGWSWTLAGILLLASRQVIAQSDVENTEADADVSEEAADECCDSSCGNCDFDSCGQYFLFPQDPCGWNIRGWIDGGIIGNTSSPASKFNGPYNAVDRSNEAMLNQFYGILEKAPLASQARIGGRVDLLYGEDFLLAQSLGMEVRPNGTPHWNPEYYGLAIPQAYASIGRKDLWFQVGHFYSVVGYEGLMAPTNFFYSKSYSYQFAGPFTHWGGQLNWQPNQAWTFNAGLTNGWNALDRVSDDVGVIAKVRYDSQATGAWTSYAITTGKEFNNLAGLDIVNDYANRTRYSWLVGLPLTCRMEYVFHHWLGFQEDGYFNGERADWFGIDQYVTYSLNRCWKAGARFEWFKDDEGTRVGLNRASNPNKPPFPGDFYSLSLGLNWMPNSNVIVRPEVRADWYDGDAVRLPYDDGVDDTQFMVGCDAMLLF